MIYDEQTGMNEQKNERARGRSNFGMNTAGCQRLCVSLRQWNAI